MKKRWYLLLIAAGLLLCAVPLQFPQHLPKPVFALLAAGGSVLVGGSLGSLLCRVIRIRDPVLVQAYKEQHDERNTMICEKAAQFILPSIIALNSPLAASMETMTMSSPGFSPAASMA